MKKTQFLALAALFALLLAAAGCSNKPHPKGPGDGAGLDSGTTEGTKPDRVSSKVEPPEPKPPSEQPIEDEGPLKNVYFDFDRYDIRPDQRPTMEANARWLADHPAEHVLIEGHCDERGTEEYNLALGDRRANSARAYLVNLGIKAGRLSTVSYGKTRPVDRAQNEAAWARNRRAEFKLGGAAIR